MGKPLKAWGQLCHPLPPGSSAPLAQVSRTQGWAPARPVDPQGLGQLCKGSVEPEIYRSINTTVFSQTGLDPFVSSEADAEPRRTGSLELPRVTR